MSTTAAVVLTAIVVLILVGSGLIFSAMHGAWEQPKENAFRCPKCGGFKFEITRIECRKIKRVECQDQFMAGCGWVGEFDRDDPRFETVEKSGQIANYHDALIEEFRRKHGE
jgi:predicted RNA-binding Zn-ribbon protein involved in translation (DUF1610 family)